MHEQNNLLQGFYAIDNTNMKAYDTNAAVLKYNML